MTRTDSKILIAAIVLLAILATGFLAFAKFRQTSLLDNGQVFSRTISENILGTWNADYFRQVADPGLLASFDTGGIDAMFRTFRRIGSLQSLGEARGELLNASWLPSDEPVMARYYIEAEFSAGRGEVYVELVATADGWNITNFYIQSPLLAE